MLAISFSRQSYGQLEWAFTPRHYVHFFTGAYYLSVLGDTLWLGVITTAVSLLLGYPLAYHLALTNSRWKPLLIVFILSPLLVGIVIRCYGWMILLADRGLINETLAQHGWITKPLPLSLPGILAGSLLVFSLAISSFVVPILVGGFKVHVLPMVVYEQVLSVFDWPFGAANAFVLLVISVALIAVYIKVTERALRGIV